MRALVAIVIVLAAMSLPLSGQSGPWDAKFRTIPEASRIGDYMKRMSARPHHLGSPYDKDNAEWILARFQEWGWDARIETYDVLFPTPKERVVEMLAPSVFKLALEEPAVAIDPTSSQKAEQLPSFNAYSIDGDVTAPLVYANLPQRADLITPVTSDASHVEETRRKVVHRCLRCRCHGRDRARA